MDTSWAGRRGPLCFTVFVSGLSADMSVGSGICKGLGVTVAWAIGREGSVEEIGLGEGQWWGGNCLLERIKRPKDIYKKSDGEDKRTTRAI